MITNKSVAQIEKTLRKDIIKYSKGDYYNFLKLVDNFAIFETYFNNILSDVVVEKLLLDFTKKEIPRCPCNRKNNRIVFYDQIGTTICLGVQYLRGLASAGYEVYYVFDSVYVDIDEKLIDEIKEYGVNYKVFDKTYCHNDPVTRIKGVRDFIIGIEPSKMIVHSPANNSYSSCVLYALDGITKYRVVPGDHHFYTGVGCIDFFFEFRESGIGVANKFRDIPMQKIIRLPFYPIVSSFYDFAGFPEETNNKIIVLSAGAENKFFGSDLFFEVSHYILTRHSKAVIVHIGAYSYKFVKFVKKNNLEGRFFLMGFRKDFSECVKRCDILLSSFPMIGGLVSQMAASYKKPILGIKENDNFAMLNNIEEILGIKEDLGITHSSRVDLYKYIDKLIEDNDFREKLGKTIYDKMYKEANFNERLKEALISPQKFTHEKYDEKSVLASKEAYFRYSLRLQNERRPTCVVPLFNFYGMRFFTKFPRLIIPFVKLMIMHIADKLFK